MSDRLKSIARGARGRRLTPDGIRDQLDLMRGVASELAHELRGDVLDKAPFTDLTVDGLDAVVGILDRLSDDPLICDLALAAPTVQRAVQSERETRRSSRRRQRGRRRGR